MAIAFCILAHKNPAQIARLLRSIWHSENTYVIHYDRRSSSAEHRSINELKAIFPGLTTISSRTVNWGRFSQMQAQLDMLAMALKLSKVWNHAFTISGQDFPLLRSELMDVELSAEPRKSFVSWFDPLEHPHWKDAWDRLTLWHLDSAFMEHVLRLPGLGRIVRAWAGWQNRIPTIPLLRRKRPDFFRWRGGANHHLLSRDAVRYLLEDQYALRIAKWLRHSGFPEEAYVQSALMNSTLAETVINDDRRAIYWDKGAASPRTLTVNDLPQLRRDRENGKLFARKFDTSVDDEVICELEKDLGL
jgi:hypothetical protein